MKSERILLGTLAALCAASAAFAQPTDTYVSGLLHTPLGDAQFGPVDGRRLPVNNLGSSGQDGVECRLNSAFGGGASIDLEPFLSTPGASIRTRHRGWDGLIYGNHRLTSNGDGTAIATFDYSDMGATGVEIVEHDPNGVVIFDGTFPGPIVDLPLDNQIFYCPPGTTPVAGVWYGQMCYSCPWITVFIFWCGDIMYTADMVVTPILPVGTPDSPGIESMMITGSGIPELAVSNAHLRTYGVDCWGLDPAQINEQCDNPVGCTPAERRLHADNLGSSGNDGIAVALPPNTGGVSVALYRPRCCRGHVIIMKLYDDEGQELRVSRTQTTDPTGVEVLDADYAALGATGFHLTLLDDAGVVVGPPGGTDIFNGGPRPYFTNRCPEGSTEWWTNAGTPGNPIWVFQGCIGNPYDFVLPDGSTVLNVGSFRVEPLGATSSFGSRVRCELTSDDDQGLVLEGVVVTPPPTYVSGLQHTALGDAQLGPVSGRRLPVNNLGSSGEDGVEIQLNSAFGGGAEIDLQPLMSTPGASFRTRHKGWDGLIYGNHRLTSNGDGTGIITFDYSDMGATGVEVVEHDPNGVVILDQTFAGPSVDLPLDQVIFYCPPPAIPTAGVWYGQLCNTCPWITVFVFFCDGTMYTNDFVATPILPVGGHDSPGIESMSITGSGIPELTVSNANLRTYGVQCWGLDPAQISEQCDDPAGCTPEQRKLHADNLGSSGNDGIAVALPPNTGGVTVARGTKGCCRGHVIIMKLYDDGGQELRVSRTQTTDPTGIEVLDADYSALGATGFHLTLLDDAGVVIGPPGGTDIFNGGPRPYFTNRCPPGSTEWWTNTGTPSNPQWTFQGCIGDPYDFVLPGSGEVVPNVSSFRVEPLDATSSFGSRTRCELTSDDDQGLVIEGVVVTPFAKGDLNCDGAVNFDDINPFVLALADPTSYAATYPNCSDLNADCNVDGVVNFDDINPFVAILSQ